jgi:hypothetical protein
MTKTNLTALIDSFGALKAQQAELAIQEKALKAALADLDVGAYEGEQFRLNITAPERETLSDELKARTKEAVEAFHASLSCQYRTAHITKVPTRTLTVRARSGKSLEA